MGILKRTWNFWHRLRRMPRTRGFGVQSPTAYSFLRTVVNESCFLKCHRYDCEFLASYPHRASRRDRLLCRVCYVYPHMKVVDLRKSIDFPVLDSLVSKADSDTVLIVLHPDANRLAAEKWAALVGDKRSILTYDMKDCGIAFFDPTKSKQHFEVNY